MPSEIAIAMAVRQHQRLGHFRLQHLLHGFLQQPFQQVAVLAD